MLLVRNAACHASCVEKTRLERPPESAEDAVDVEDVGVAKPWRELPLELQNPLTAPLTTLEVATLLLAIVKDVVGAEGAGGADGAAGAGGAAGAEGAEGAEGAGVGAEGVCASAGANACAGVSAGVSAGADAGASENTSCQLRAGA
jgi:hypothetical protein